MIKDKPFPIWSLLKNAFSLAKVMHMNVGVQSTMTSLSTSSTVIVSITVWYFSVMIGAFIANMLPIMQLFYNSKNFNFEYFKQRSASANQSLILRHFMAHTAWVRSIQFLNRFLTKYINIFSKFHKASMIIEWMIFLNPKMISNMDLNRAQIKWRNLEN